VVINPSFRFADAGKSGVVVKKRGLGRYLIRLEDGQERLFSSRDFRWGKMAGLNGQP